jgi:hypothetical protein
MLAKANCAVSKQPDSAYGIMKGFRWNDFTATERLLLPNPLA